MCGLYKANNVCNIIGKNVYETVKYCAFAGNAKSNYFSSNTGVKQGQTLSRLLLALNINYLVAVPIAVKGK